MSNSNEVMDVEERITEILEEHENEMRWSSLGEAANIDVGFKSTEDAREAMKQLIAQQNAVLLEPLIELIDDISGCEQYERSIDSLICKWCGRTEYNWNHDKMRLLQAIPASILEAKLKEITKEER